ncbi:uncharacterized protein LOC130824256 [Amaranthus tricolor]|uniref:uncharacterized protein LOC130824256 n=1 Tax=Amaranthus tricolor TaxID=29722 RepID=UPI00259125C0|nr:uncharacterized protein LOC130824256 [Amaranthus tricolor]
MSTDLNSNSPIMMIIIDQTVQNPSSNQHKKPNNPISSDQSKNQSDHVKKEIMIKDQTVVDDSSTPTSDENKIPAPHSPPPAPRKRRYDSNIACRKKLDFIDQQKYPQLIIPKDEDLQQFFASSFEQIQSRKLLKRRCSCISS